MFAIRNKKTGKFVYGTDKRYMPHHQRTSKDQMLTFDEFIYAAAALKHRRCGKNYEVVELEPMKVRKSFTREETENILAKYGF